MDIGAIGRNYSANTAGKDAAPASTGAEAQAEQEAKPAYEKYDRLVHGLTKLTEATEKADEETKARAKQKLKDAQEQLKFMQRWGMDPAVIARLAAQLGAVVAAAAREFAGALGNGGIGGAAGGEASGVTAAPGVAPERPSTRDAKPAETQQADTMTESAGDEPAGERNSDSQAQQAYRDVMDDGAPTQTSRLSPDDIRTAMEFSTVARQIKALLEEAARNLREQSNTSALPGTQNLDAAVTAMTSAVSAAPSVSITI